MSNRPTTARHRKSAAPASGDYEHLVADIGGLLEQARRTAARSVNSILTATYWQIGRRIVAYEQGGKKRAEYGEALMRRLAKDLVSRLGRGFSKRNLDYMRAFYLNWEIVQTPSAQFEARLKLPTTSGERGADIVQIPPAESLQLLVSLSPAIQPAFPLAGAFPLSWSQYVRLMSVENPRARAFYESEAIRGGWSVRQLDRQISTRFYERAVRSKHPHALLAHAQSPKEGDAVTVEEEVRDPYLLEFLNLKDEYSETELEEALIRHLEWFLLEMGTGFTFVARQKRVRVGRSWYRIDL